MTDKRKSEIRVDVGDMYVCVTGPPDELEDVEEVFDRQFTKALKEYREIRELEDETGREHYQ